MEEIQSTLLSMSGLKALGLDCFHALFYQSQRDIVGNSICQLVFKMFDKPKAIHFINQTFISLIPKIDKLELLKHFRSNGLCNVSYKLITKILANQLKRIMPKIIALTMASFQVDMGRTI